MSGDSVVLIRADAGMGMGYGHLFRCLALAHALVAQGVAVVVASRLGDEGLSERITATGASFVHMGAVEHDESANGPLWDRGRQRADAESLLGRLAGRVAAVVVDHYRLDSEWESVWTAHGVRVVAIDDLADRRHTADVIVDHNWYGPHTAGRYQNLSKPGCVHLLGPRYSLLQPEYASLRRHRAPVREEPRAAVVSFGGTDVTGQSVHAVHALSAFPDIRTDVVVGTRKALTRELEDAVVAHGNAALHVAVPSLAPLLARADLAIGAGGTSTWERLCMGVPALVTTVSSNQSGVTRQFHEEGLVTWLGTADAVTEEHYRAAIAGSASGQRLTLPDIVDGQGAGRVALAITQASRSEARSRAAVETDRAAFVTASGAGVNDCEGSTVWRERTERFRSLTGGDGDLSIVEVRGVPVGIGSAGRTYLDPYIVE